MSKSEVRQWITNQDGLDKLRLESAALPEPGDDEVLVEIHAVSLNYRDTEVCSGTYGHHKSLSQGKALVPCSDMAGVVVKVGKNKKASRTWKEGDRVLSIFNQTHQTGQVTEKDMASGLGFPLPGVLATHRVFPVDALVKAPDSLSDEEASTLPIAATTAWMSLNGMRPAGQIIGKDEIVLLQGTGGVSIAGLQIAAAAGADTIITSSSDEKLERARKLGAKHVINYRTNPDWQDEVLRLTDGKGADIVFEIGGAQTLRKSFDCVAFGGTIACIGYTSGKEDEPGGRLNTNVLALRRNVTLKGILNGPRDRMEEMCAFVADHDVHPVVDKVFSFEEADKAIQYLAKGNHFGKVVVKISGGETGTISL